MVTAGVTIIWWIVGVFISDALSDNHKYDDVIGWLGYIALILLVLTVISFIVFIVVVAHVL